MGAASLGVTMKRSVATVLAFWLALSTAVVIGWPTSALSLEDEETSPSPTSSPSGPLLDALAFAPPEIMTFQFTDWAALKALHRGSDITSASPLEDRQRLVLEMVNSEVSQFDFGLARLATWPELWGWDNTDLAWEATWVDPFGPSARILRFREGWDPKPFMARLEGYGYSRSEKAYGTLFGGDPYELLDAGTQVILDHDERLTQWPSSVAISKDGRTVAIGEEGQVHKILKVARRVDPAAVVASPLGRVATALGRPVTAILVDGDFACSDVGPASVDSRAFAGEIITRPDSVGPLHPYQAFGIGYERAGPGEPGVGRLAFAYKRAKQMKADRSGRRTLIDERYSSLSGRPAHEVATSHTGASPDDRTLVLDAALLDDSPGLLFDMYWHWALSPVACR